MVKPVKITKEHDIGLYDSDTGKSLKAKKAVDITDECPSGTRTILLFTKAKRGRIVQIGQPYDHEVYMGMHVHYFVDELDGTNSKGFGSWAGYCGLTSKALTEIIKANAP